MMIKYANHLISLIPAMWLTSYLNGIHKLLLPVLSGLLLSLSFLNHDYFYCAWFGLVPLFIAIKNTSLLTSYLIGLIAGLTLFITSTYWILDFIELSKDYGVQSGYLLAGLYWFYSAHLIALTVLLFKWLDRYSHISEFITLPVIFVVFFSCFPMLFPMRLADTQVNFPSALQGIAYVGAHGLDAIIILGNLILFRLLAASFSPSNKSSSSSRFSIILAISVIALWFLYGVNSYSLWQNNIQTWETLKVGLVQANEVPKLGGRVQYPGYSQTYPPEMDMTERLSSAGAELIIWPEAQTKYYLDNSTVQQAYQKNIQALNTHLLFQDMQHIHNPIDGKPLKQFNSAIMLNNHGQQVDTYQKMKRIPFGEYAPFIEYNLTASKWMASLFGEFTSGLSQGQQHKIFHHPKVNIIPLICYETTFSEFVAKAVDHTPKTLTSGSILVGLSNDGWFGSTHLPYQHIMPSVLRAVENRLPLVHVANNGPSIVVTPSGEVIFTSDFQQAAGYVVDVPYSNTAQGSFYSRYPALLTDSFVILFLIIMGLALKQRILRKITAHSLE